MLIFVSISGVKLLTEVAALIFQGWVDDMSCRYVQGSDQDMRSVCETTHVR